MEFFQKFVLCKYGEQGKLWLSHLPLFVSDIAKQCGLSDLRPLANLTYHYVLEGWQGKSPIILKIGLDEEDLCREARALRVFSNYGAVKIIQESRGFLLLERAIPGTSLKSYFPFQEEQSLHIFCRVMERLHQVPPPSSHNFPHVKDILRLLDSSWEIPLSYLKKAREKRDSLLSSSQSCFFLHGDLHHDNILKKKEDWIVIDPKGVVGEIGYEVAKFIQNPLREAFLHKKTSILIQNRIHYFSKNLSIEPSRLKDWCFVQSVLAWVWALEDETDPKFFENLVGILS